MTSSAASRCQGLALFGLSRLQVGLNAFTRILARELADTYPGERGVPRLVRTAMGGQDALAPWRRGTFDSLAALLPDDGRTAGFSATASKSPGETRVAFMLLARAAAAYG